MRFFRVCTTVQAFATEIEGGPVTRRKVIPFPAILSFILAAVLSGSAIAERGNDPAPAGSNTAWMLQAKYGLLMHYHYRILLGKSIRTNPQFPQPSEMNAFPSNQFVSGFDTS